jgi:hypothetical protein
MPDSVGQKDENRSGIANGNYCMIRLTAGLATHRMADNSVNSQNSDHRPFVGRIRSQRKLESVGSTKIRWRLPLWEHFKKLKGLELPPWLD